MSYNYAQGNLLDKPNTYFYSQFFGADFLLAWRKQRDEIKIKLENFSMLSVDALPTPIESSLLLSEINNKDLVDINRILKITYLNLINTGLNNDPNIKIIVNKLVKKFEVSKRWYINYGTALRTLPEYKDDQSAYSNLDLYIQGAELFEEAYVQSGNLPYLNVLLKSMDTLCASVDDLTTDSKSRLFKLIDKEKKCFDSLQKSLNITI